MTFYASISLILLIAAAVVAWNRGEWGSFIVGAVLLIIAAFIGNLAVKQHAQWYDSAHWATASATIEKSAIRKEIRKTGDNVKKVTHHFDVSYTYAVDGQTYTGHVYAVGMTTSSEEKVNELVKAYPLGKNISIIYAPDDPAQSAIIRGESSSGWLLYALALAPGLFGGVLVFRTLQGCFARQSK